MAVDLDNVAQLRAMDPKDMLGWVERFPEQCADAWVRADAISLPDTLRDKKHIVVVGMGGSAIGGDLLSAYLSARAAVPVTVVRHYTLPAWVNEDTLIIASSYSGNTEETLSAFRQALEKGLSLVALTTGGRLARLALDHQVPVVVFPGGGQPRAALGYSFVLLLGIVQALGYYTVPGEERAEAAAVLDELNRTYGPDVPREENPAKQHAEALFGRIPYVMGSGVLAPVARRWKTQFNENSKQWAAFDEMPELNHNTVMGTRAPDLLPDVLTLISLESPTDHPRIRLRWDITADIFRKAKLPHLRIQAPGEHALSQMLGLIHLGDFITVYLAFLNGQDPSSIDNIDFLKAELAKR